MTIYNFWLWTIVAQAAAQDAGRWEPVITLPIIPMAGAVIPETNQLLLWAAAKPNIWTNGNASAKYTLTTSIDLATMAVSQQNVSNTGHDMFCPGISMGADGRIIVSGGSTATPVSAYDIATGQWNAIAELNVPRGYHSTAVTSEGRIFAIGGSWSGGFGGKIGEIYDPAQNIWNPLPGCDVNAILTNDAAGIYRADNHANLFTWKNASIFHAGPSKLMHWFDTRGNGRTIAAGLRLSASDGMCGNAVMYDAGKILTLGGSASYENSPGTSQSFVVTLGDAYDAVVTEAVADLNIPRTLSNAVVLPDGQILVTGGQQFSVLFTDFNAVQTPELYNPVTKTWQLLSNESIPRTYHSISLLLPDGRVFSGGGGGCGDGCVYNHYDGSIFTPPYLTGDNTRPVIEAITDNTVLLGTSVAATVNVNNCSFALLRIGTATHTVNTDQRRIALTPSSVEGNTYVLPIPADAGVLPPGYWYLFAVSSDGTPSVAHTLRLVDDSQISPLQLNFPDINRPCAGGFSADSFYTAFNGETYALCQDTSFNTHKDLAEVPDIANIQDCSTVCSRTPGCTMTSYVATIKACYLKYGRLTISSPEPGVPSSIKVLARPCANNTSVSSITATADGRIFGVCANTDFQTEDSYVDVGVFTAEDCARRCAAHLDCISATLWCYMCYMKTVLGQPAADQAVQAVIRMQTSPCLGNLVPTNITYSNNGDVYGICAGQDFVGADLASRSDIANIQACVQLCAELTSCAAMTYDRDTQTCSLKWTTSTAISWPEGDAAFRIGIHY